MSATVIELNDAGIIAHAGDGMLLESPGYAILEDPALLVGHEAYHRARLNPRQINNRFWEELNLDPLPKPTATARHHADIAYAHLTHIWEQIRSETSEVILAVPGVFDRQQLGLLLGIAQECSIPIIGLVDTAVVASSRTRIPDRTLLHLDMQLHRFVLTRLAQGAELRRVRIDQLAKTGLAVLEETWANAVAAAFVRKTRFDPLHSAETEQQLYDRLPIWLSGFRDEVSAPFELQAREGKTYSITLDRAWFSRTAAGIYQKIAGLIRDCTQPGESVALQLSHRFGDLPGLVDSLAQLNDVEIIQLQTGVAARGALEHRAQICTSWESLHFVTYLPRQDSVAIAGASPIEASGALAVPTHILYQARAYPIGDRPFTLGADIPANAYGLNLAGPLNGVSRSHCSICWREGQVWVDDHSTYGTFLNERKVQGSTVVRIGDRLRLGTPGEELQLITLVD